jgi:MinD-like ATPase involved in chromosome partitioning or flagellar assembly
MQRIAEQPMSEPLPAPGPGDQAEGLRRLFASQPVALSVGARETDLIDAYARIKRLAHERNCHHFRVSVSRARSATEARKVFDNLQRVAREYLGVRLEYVGMAEAEHALHAAAPRRERGGSERQESML